MAAFVPSAFSLAAAAPRRRVLSAARGGSAFVAPAAASSALRQASPRVAGAPDAAPAGGRGMTMQIVDEEELLKTRTHELFMPALSSTMTEGVIVEWLKKPGDFVEAGDMVMVVQSDKADMDVESFETGYLASVLVEEGGTAAVGATVALLAEKEEDLEAVRECGLDCMVSGSNSRHDGTTAVEPALDEAAVAAVAASSGQAPAATPAAPAVEDDVSANELFMPALSSTMTEGVIVEWLKKPGDYVEAGDMVMVVQSDKADMDVEAFESGFLASVLVEEGGSAAKMAKEGGVDLATVAGSGPGGRIVAEDVSAALKRGPAAASGGASAAAAPSGVLRATPDAVKVAKKEGIKLESVKGTGNFGRITADDVLVAAGKPPLSASWMTAKPAAAAAPSSSSSVTSASSSGASAPTAAAAVPMPEGAVAMTAMQKAVVSNMNATLGVPVYRVSYGIKTTAFDALYAKLKPKGVTVSSLLAKAVGMTLTKHPIMNASYSNNAIVYRKDVNVAMAVSLPDGGLITPVLAGADVTDLYSLSRSWKDLVKRALQGKLKPAEYSTGTFFVSNMGMFGVSQFDSILPAGAGGILAIGASQPTVVVPSPGTFAVEKKMTVTITCDHRHIYGSHAAEFLRDLADLIENDVDSLLY
ncbi:hypothetical protein I4F81_009128 [Pyropia yezoensis]|uniref:Uncharacterized protein n=1 Tax=Pyropia yezoensis TaxID=2788 RepID=A0ACC3C8W4_PYRYE|nr:hypothetical protein I4F81_009128 [Neopyropia yezoensis]